MKKITRIALFGISGLFMLSSCKKVIQNVFGGTDITMANLNVSVPAIAAATSYEIAVGTYTYSFNLDSAIRANTDGFFGASSVNSVKVKQVDISISNSDSLNNLANFDSARVTIYSTSNTSPATLFNVGFPDSTASQFTATPVSSPELISYVRGSILTLTLYGMVRRPTAKALNLNATIIIRAN